MFFVFDVWLLNTTPVAGQVTFSDWIIRSGTTGWDIVNDIAIDTSGNVYITGSNTDTTSTSKLLNIKTNSVRYQYVEKFDTSGKLLWHRRIVPTDEGYGGLLAITRDNHIIIAGGAVQGNADGKPNYKKISFFLTCIDVGGDLLWTQTFTGTNLDYFTSLTLNPVDQTIQLAGYFQDTLSIDQEKVVSTHRSDALLLNFESCGKFKNMQLISGIGHERISAVAYDILGYRYLAGTFHKKVNLGNDVYLENERPNEDAVFIAQYDRFGKLMKGKKVCAGKNVKIKSFVRVGDRFFIAGCFGNILKAENHELYSKGSDDIFIICLDNKMTPAWIKQFGGDRKDRIAGLLVKGDDILFTGSFSSEISLGQVKISSADGGNNIFLISIDTTGNVNWTRTFGGPSDDYPKGMKSSASGFIYITGSFRETMKVSDNTIQSKGEEDVFIARLEDCNEKLPGFKRPEVLCEDDLIILDAGAGFSSYNWSNGLSYQQTLVVESEGYYPIELVSPNGCVIYDTVQVKEIDNPDIFIGNDTTIFDTSLLTLSVTGNYTSYLWNNGVKERVNVIKGSECVIGVNLIHVTVTNQNGCIGQDDLLLNVSQTNSLNILEDFSSTFFLYPNPTPDVINVYFTKSLESLNLKIYNQLGVLITEKEVTNYIQNSLMVFSLGSFPPGLYTLIIATNSGFATMKIVLQ